MAYYSDVTITAVVELDGGRAGVLVRWEDAYSGKLYQLYGNGQLLAATDFLGQAKQLRAAQTAGIVRYQVLAVDPEAAGTDYSAYLDDLAAAGNRVLLTWPRYQELEAGGYVQIYWDAGTGVIDEDTPINTEKIYNWPPGAPRPGHGAGTHGAGPHGDEGDSVGFGRQAHGYGPHGRDVDTMEFLTEETPAGTYQFRLRQFDKAGNAGTATDVEVIVGGLPPEAGGIEVSSYTQATNTLVLTVTAGTEKMPYG